VIFSAPPMSSPVAPRPNEAPTVDLPPLVRGMVGAATLITGTARDADGRIARIDVALGAALPVRGTTSFTALAPPLPAGAYGVAARALDDAGAWGPWSSATLLVDAAIDEPLDSAALADDARRETAAPTWLATLAVLFLLARRRR
jgi:hypothetical protein